MLRARLRNQDGTCDAQIVDASSRGLSMTSQQVPARGEIVEVVLDRTVLIGQVRWCRGNRFGVVLQQRIDVSSLHSGVIRTLPSAGDTVSHAPAQRFALTDILFFAAGILAAAAFLFQAYRNWM